MKTRSFFVDPTGLLIADAKLLTGILWARELTQDFGRTGLSEKGGLDSRGRRVPWVHKSWHFEQYLSEPKFAEPITRIIARGHSRAWARRIHRRQQQLIEIARNRIGSEQHGSQSKRA